MNKRHFYLKLIPPRPTFAQDMSESERALMQDHARYVLDAFQRGKVLVYGPVLASAGAFGMAILEMTEESEVQQFAEADPSICAGLNTFEFHPMKVAAARGLEG
jgi:uncharacterized protein